MTTSRLANRIAVPAIIIVGYFALRPVVTGHAVGDEGCAGPLPEDDDGFAMDVDMEGVDTSESGLAAGCTKVQVFADPKPFFKLDFDDNATLAAGLSYRADGRSGKAVTLETGIVTIPAADALKLDGNGTLSLWINFAAVLPTKETYIVAAANVAKSTLFYLTVTNNKLKLATKVGSASTVVSKSISDLNASKWSHVAVTWDAQTETNAMVRVYFDGKMQMEMPRTASFPLSSGPSAPTEFYLENKITANDYVTLSMDSVRSFDRALDALAIESLYRHDLGLGIRLNPNWFFGLAGPGDGYYGIVRIYSRPAGEHLIRSAEGRLWSLDFEPSQPDAAPPLTLSSQAYPAACVANAGGGVTLTWSAMTLPSPAAQAGTVAVTVTLTPEPGRRQMRAKIKVYNDTSWRLRQTNFPEIYGLRPVGQPDSSAMAVLYPNFSVGTIGRGTKGNLFVKESVANALLWDAYQAPSWPGSNHSMQWTALYNEVQRRGGLYLAAEDHTGWLKSWRWGPDHDGIANLQALKVALVTYAADAMTPGNDHDPGWSAVIGLQDGGWYSMARRYRYDVALKAPWTAHGTLYARKDIQGLKRSPNWMQNSGLMAWSVNNSFQKNWDLQNVASEVGTAPSMLFWHFLHWQFETRRNRGVMDDDNPASITFPKAQHYVCKARQLEVGVGGYLCPTVWDATVDRNLTDPLGWTAAAAQAAAKKNAAGKYIERTCSRPHEEGQWPAPHEDGNASICEVRMCPHVAAWQDVLAEVARVVTTPTNEVSDCSETLLAETPRAMGMQAVFFDEGARHTPQLCCSPDHGHPTCGGTYLVEGYRTLFKKTRTAAQEGFADAGQYTEDFSEAYIDVMDGFLLWNERPDNWLPLAQAVYHDYAMFLGTEIYDQYRTFESAVATSVRDFSWGVVLGATYVNTDKNNKELLKVRLRLGQLRQKYSQYLVYGEMLEPPAATLLPSGGNTELPQIVATLSQVPQSIPSHTLMMNVSEVNNTALVFQTVVVTAWRAPDGGVGVVLASTDPDTLRRVFVPLMPQGKFSPSGPVYQVGPMGDVPTNGTVGDKTKPWTKVSLETIELTTGQVTTYDLAKNPNMLGVSVDVQPRQIVVMELQ